MSGANKSSPHSPSDVKDPPKPLLQTGFPLALRKGAAFLSKESPQHFSGRAFLEGLSGRAFRSVGLQIESRHSPNKINIGASNMGQQPIDLGLSVPSRGQPQRLSGHAFRARMQIGHVGGSGARGGGRISPGRGLQVLESGSEVNKKNGLLRSSRNLKTSIFSFAVQHKKKSRSPVRSLIGADVIPVFPSMFIIGIFVDFEHTLRKLIGYNLQFHERLSEIIASKPHTESPKTTLVQKTLSKNFI